MTSILQPINDAGSQFRFEDWRPFVVAHIDVVAFAVAFYLVVVFKGPQAMKYRRAYRLKLARALWNLSLSLFSIWGGSNVIPKLLFLIRDKGLVYSICAPISETGAFDGKSGLWLTLFVFSKIPELIDTVFLVLNKKPVIFLHWYHHVTVLLFCFNMFITRSSAGIWFAAMNYFVHSLMYMYYFLMTLNAQGVVRAFASTITALQLLQMFIGMLIVLVMFVNKWRDCECGTDWASARLGLGMYTSYFVLFAQFFIEKYITKPEGVKPITEIVASAKSPRSSAQLAPSAATTAGGSSTSSRSNSGNGRRARRTED